MMPEEMKQKISLFAFKCEIKQQVPDNSPCKMCKNYLPNMGFIYHPLFLTIHFLSIFYIMHMRICLFFYFVLILECSQLTLSRFITIAINLLIVIFLWSTLNKLIITNSNKNKTSFPCFRMHCVIEFGGSVLILDVYFPTKYRVLM